MSLMVLSLMAPTHVSHESYVLYARMLLGFLWLVLMCSHNVSSSVYINIWLTVFYCPRPGILPDCVCGRKRRCVFMAFSEASLRMRFASMRVALPQVTRG